MKMHPKGGLTLIEVLTSMTIASFIMAAVMSTFLLIARSSQRISHYNDMETESSRSLEVLAREVRMAISVKCTPVSSGPLHILSRVQLRVPDEESTPVTEYEVLYSFRTETDASVSLVRQVVGDPLTKVLVRNIDPNRAHTFIRYDQAPGFAINDYSTNQIQLSMTVQPNDRGRTATTSERMLSAYFVLRNR